MLALLSLETDASSRAQQVEITFFVISVGSGKGADFGGLTWHRRRSLVLLLRRRLAIAHIMPHPQHRARASHRAHRTGSRADARRSEVK
jgi:hypothetical protein